MPAQRREMRRLRALDRLLRLRFRAPPQFSTVGGIGGAASALALLSGSGRVLAVSGFAAGSTLGVLAHLATATSSDIKPKAAQ